MLNRILELLAILSLGLGIWRWAVSIKFPLHRRRLPAGKALPGVTVLKPLKGCNAEIARALRSWFVQDFDGPIQILFGVADENDPACAVIRALLADFPKADARLIICGQLLGANGKVSTLSQLEPHITHPNVMISDADVEVTPDFCTNIVPMLDQPGVGLVNCFYRLANPSTLAMRWEAVAINADFWSQVLQARSLGPVDFALGAVMSMPAEMVKKIGGFGPLADYLADDYELGRSVARAGGRIEFARVPVDCRETLSGWADVWKHQLRWARTIRVCRPASYFFSILGNFTIWPLLWLAMSRTPAAAEFFAVAVAFRIIMAIQLQYRLTQTRGHAAYWWMAPVKDILDFMIWAAAFWGNQVMWRGEPYRVSRGGKLARAGV